MCTHDYATERYSGSYFDVVVLDEIGALDLYKGSTLVGLARYMAKLMGDPLQGSRPCTTLADKHVQNVSNFKTHSYRCPQKVMEIVQPAYQAKFGDKSLTLTGVDDRLHWCVQTDYNASALRTLWLGYEKQNCW